MYDVMNKFDWLLKKGGACYFETTEWVYDFKHEIIVEWKVQLQNNNINKSYASGDWHL